MAANRHDRRVSDEMGKLKDFLLRIEEENEKQRAENPSDPGVPDDGGDDMDQQAQDWIDQKNEFGRLEAEQEQAAYEAEMRRDLDAIGVCPNSHSQLDAKTVFHGGIAGGVVLQKQRHSTLILEDVCTHCAHCALKLTDAESVERGLGPVCSKKGYFEEPKDADEMQAFIDLAEYPELCEFLTKNYKPQGVRGLVNGLVRVCSLNRKSKVHKACTDAIQSLGYKKLASLLRESLCAVEIKESKDHPGSVEVWCKKATWKYGFTNGLKEIPGAFFSRSLKATVVPLYRKDPDGKDVPLTTPWSPEWNGPRTLVANKRIVWSLLAKYYLGHYVKTTRSGCVKVTADPGEKAD